VRVRASFQVPTTVHGHCELESPDEGAGPRPLLVGFHGYAETAERHLEALGGIPGIAGWRRCAVQALHPFYRGKTGEVVASWMTRFNRELAIAENVRYVAEVVTRVKNDFPTREPLAWVGFSQGTAMAYRAAAGAGHRGQVLIALGGDVPPELAEGDLTGFPHVLIGRGTTDPWYSEEKLETDVALLEGKGVTVEVCCFDGGHEWSDGFYRVAGKVLEDVERSAGGV
jgi:predicted esterase